VNICQGSMYRREDNKYSPAVDIKARTTFAKTLFPKRKSRPDTAAWRLRIVRYIVAKRVYAIMMLNPHMLMVNNSRALHRKSF